MQAEELTTSKSHSEVARISGMDDIDVSQFIRVLISRWLDIIAIAGITVILVLIGVLIYERLRQPVYISSALVAIARVTNDITFDERFRTVSEAENSALSTNVTARRAALRGLVNNGLIAQTVINQMSDELTDAEKTPAALMQVIDAQIVAGSNSRIESDLIRISAESSDAEKASLIANMWADSFVEHVNQVYGQTPKSAIDSLAMELELSEQNFSLSQQNVEAFLARNQVRSLQRQIDEKQGIIDSLQAGKQTAIDTIVEEELNARRQIISAYINSLASNRLLGFQKEQQSKRDVIDAYLDAEAANRVAAIAEDRRMRETLFRESTDAQIEAVTSIIHENTKGQINLLRQNYRTRLELSKILDQAEILRSQIQEAGNDGITTNEGALLLLKAQLASLPTVSDPLVAQIDLLSAEQLTDRERMEEIAPIINNLSGTTGATQFNIDIGQPSPGDADSQLNDATAFIRAIKAQIVTIDERIVALADGLAAGAGYKYDSLSPESLGATQELDTESGTESDELFADSDLSAAIQERYLELFGVGTLAKVENSVAESEVLTQIEALYPELFTLGSLSQLTDDVPEDTPLALVSLEKAQQLLQLQGLEDIPEYTASAEPLIQAIDKLDSEIQLLQAQLEAERSREQQLIQQRDLAWETYITLSNKSAELNLAQSATNSEVRLAAPAVPPVEPEPGISLALSLIAATLIGLFLGILVAILGHFLNYKPLLRHGQPSPA